MSVGPCREVDWAPTTFFGFQEDIGVEALIEKFAEQMRELDAAGTVAAARTELDDNGLRSRPAV